MSKIGQDIIGGLKEAILWAEGEKVCDLQARSRNNHENARLRLLPLALACPRLYASIASTASFFRGLAAK
jgi:hypothetical protein